jgi:hypothetical protein
MQAIRHFAHEFKDGIKMAVSDVSFTAGPLCT